MGKASSAKKISRAARAGGRVSSGQPRSLLFPGVLLVVVMLGVSLVVYARAERSGADLGGVPQLGDHIHAAFAVNVCGEAADPLPEFEHNTGLHTHGADGVMHIHPFSSLGTGINATLGRFLKNAREGQPPLNVSISDTKLVYMENSFEEGKTKCGGLDGDATLRVAYWENVSDPEAKPVITTGGFEDLRLTKDGSGFTIYFGDPKGEIPKPPAAANLEELGAADGGSTVTTSGEGDATSTTAPEGSSTTTAESSTTVTTAG